MGRITVWFGSIKASKLNMFTLASIGQQPSKVGRFCPGSGGMTRLGQFNHVNLSLPSSPNKPAFSLESITDAGAQLGPQPGPASLPFFGHLLV